VVELLYRPNVAIIIINEKGEILACHRSDVKGAWQFPQGGIEQNESLEDAMRRELREEIGTDEVDIIGILPYRIKYDWPKELYKRGFRGQEQAYFLTKLRASAEVDLEQSEGEFDRVEWIPAGEFIKRLSGFKVEAYREALDYFKGCFPNMISEGV
jgi:putative (di)nucleoside polyphosphate hydrolase